MEWYLKSMESERFTIKKEHVTIVKCPRANHSAGRVSPCLKKMPSAIPPGEGEAEDDIQCGVFVQDAQSNLYYDYEPQLTAFCTKIVEASLECQF